MHDPLVIIYNHIQPAIILGFIYLHFMQLIQLNLAC